MARSKKADQATPSAKDSLTEAQTTQLLATLQERFAANMNRHPGLAWKTVEAKLCKMPTKLWSVFEMERTGGEPDVVILEAKSANITFYDCSAESPTGRRSVCYDDIALNKRKENKPATSALAMAQQMGIELLNEEQYRGLQTVGLFDCKTSSWIITPEDIRALGGALFCDRRYGKVFTYHNGADSYYAVRGFRGLLVL